MRKTFTAMYIACFALLSGFILVAPGWRALANGLQKQQSSDEYGLDRIDQRQSEDIARVTQKMEDIDKRVSAIEAQKEESRITRLEAMSESNHQLLIGISLSVAVLILEALIRLLSMSRKFKQGP